jgi:type IV secretion system protein VirB7
MKRLSLIALAAVAITGCTTAGPFVTNVSSDGAGGLNVDKCSVQMNAFMGTVSNKDCSTQDLKLGSNTRSR